MTASSPTETVLSTITPEFLQGWCDLWCADDLAPEISVELSSRMTRSLGRCYPDRKLIRIARFVLEDSDALFREVLCHEAAHLAAYHLHGRSIRPHGHEWKALMQMAGYPPAVRFKESRLTKVPPVARRQRAPVFEPGLVDSILGGLQSTLLKKARSPAFKRRKR